MHIDIDVQIAQHGPNEPDELSRMHTRNLKLLHGETPKFLFRVEKTIGCLAADMVIEIHREIHREDSDRTQSRPIH